MVASLGLLFCSMLAIVAQLEMMVGAGCAASRLCCPGRNITCVAVDNVLINVLPSNSQEARKAEYVLVPQEHGPGKNKWKLFRFKRDKHADNSIDPDLQITDTDTDLLPFQPSTFTLNSESESWNKNTIYQTEADVEDNNDEFSFSFEQLPRRNNLCYCDEACIRLNDCCTDYHSVCPVTDCQVSEWTSWSACRSSSEEVESKKEPFCGHGISSRHRRIVQLPKFGGLACPILEQQRSCFGVYEPHCQKLLSEVALLLPYKYNSARRLAQKGKLYYDLPRMISKLKSIKSHCVIFETEWTNPNCVDPLQEPHRMVCVECDPRAQLNHKKGKCTGQGVLKQSTPWNLLHTKHCFGRWSKTQSKSNCRCDVDHPDLPRYIFV
ncbi:Somatomedin-B and thrombospondin type-1 domain-containing protein [Trichinella sp. T9]|uniref:Somatomedin-B and thrombospondin type-1 domain-containing protein n=1 Tax=Trichinella murrelli TaxID=144512 RepID=A0A0V0TI19_9BILA|nr:Somatomedin-B and thrombospondin type-1 domain-containing protein [Trichinella murrelli]KRX61121.1 Somatomedin-B and thrombospondin type-1 domain-containing protein [Trichinella sp. T9]